jgi:hypothetical protein
MMIMTDLFSIILRVAELVFAAIVAGVNGAYLHAVQGSDSWSEARFIYTEVVAALAIFLSIIWLFPFSGSFVHWPVDLLISICWFVAFGLMVNVSSQPQAMDIQLCHKKHNLLTAISYSFSTVHAVTSSTGMALMSTVSTRAATGRLSSRSPLSLPSCGSSRPSLASYGFVTTSASTSAARSAAALESKRVSTSTF